MTMTVAPAHDKITAVTDGDDKHQPQQQQQHQHWKRLLWTNALTALLAVGLTYSLAVVRFQGVSGVGHIAGHGGVVGTSSLDVASSSSAAALERPAPDSSLADLAAAKPLPQQQPPSPPPPRVRLGSDKRPAVANSNNNNHNHGHDKMGPGSVGAAPAAQSQLHHLYQQQPASSATGDYSAGNSAVDSDSDPDTDDEVEDDYADDDYGLAAEYQGNAIDEPEETTHTTTGTLLPGVLVDFGQGRAHGGHSSSSSSSSKAAVLVDGEDEEEDDDLVDDDDDEEGAISGVSVYDRRNLTRLHNGYRAKHGVPRLAWSTTLAQSAQAYADQCVWGHSGKSGVGENLYATSQLGSSGDPSQSPARTSVQAWYQEIYQYNYQAPGFSPATGHATQVLWKSTAYLGCGIAVCPGLFNGWTMAYVVCQYSPPGNYIGQFAQNVFPPVAK